MSGPRDSRREVRPKAIKAERQEGTMRRVKTKLEDREDRLKVGPVSCQRRAAYSTASAFGHHGSNFRLEPWGALFLSAMDVSAGCFPRSPSQALEDLGGISVSGGKR